MANPIGPCFSLELTAAGLSGLPFAWTPDGTFTFSPSMTQAQIDAVNAVYAAHDPTRPSPDQVNAIRDQRLAAGFADTGNTGLTYQCDAQSRGLLTGVGASAGLNLAVSPQPNYQLIAADNSTITLHASDAYALINGRIMPWVSATMLYARTLKDQITAGQKPDITQGWP